MISRRFFALACALFFLSGAAGLAYEVIWFKRFAHVWGSSALAAASVLGSYLLSLGAGAAVVGRFADRARAPLRWYGWSEVGIGALALLVPVAIAYLQQVAAWTYPFLAERPFAGYLARAALSLLVLGPPCFLMGGTFPLLVKELTPAGGTLREALGVLYAANTLGGAVGAYVAGFHLLPSLGLQTTNAVAVATSASVGLVALIATRIVGARHRDSGPAVESVETSAAETGSPAGEPRFPLFLLSALLSGCASLALQIAWTRQLSLVLGGSTYAFSAMLIVVLAGIGLGGLLFHLWLRRARDPRRLQAVVTLALIAAALLGQRALEPMILAVGALGPFRGNAAWNGAVCVVAASALELLPSVGMGILLPLYAASSGRRAVEAGRTSGDLYAWNTVGTLVGALGGALVILPLCGVTATVSVSLAIYLVASLLLFPSKGAGNRWALLGLAVAGACVVLLSLRGPSALLMNRGTYMYGAKALQADEGIRALHLEEGVSTNVFVTLLKNGIVSLRVNGKVDASNSFDMPMQAGSAYFPRFFRPDARDVLVIGFGSGTTSGASLLFPETQVTCAELEPAVARAAVFFENVNHRPFDSSRFRVVFNDGRSHVQGTTDRYDIIISEPSNPWIAGVSSLFTRELYAIAKERLKPGGVFAQWIQCYAFTPADYALVVRTLRQVFRHGALIRMPGTDTLLIASEESLEPTRQEVDRMQALVDATTEVKGDLERLFDTSDVRSLLLTHRILGDEGLQSLLERDGGVEVQTDMNLRLEFDAPLRLFDPAISPVDVRRSILAVTDASLVRSAWSRWGCTRTHMRALRNLVDYFADYGAWQSAAELIDFGLEIDPEEPYFRAAHFMSSMPADESAWRDGFSRILALSPEQAARVGVWLHLSKDYPRAVKTWDRLLEAFPQAATLWINLSASLDASGQKEESRRAAEKARALDPFSQFVRSSADDAAEPAK